MTQARPTLREKALKICCRFCRAGVGERCLDQRPGFYGVRIKAVHPERVQDAKAKGI